MTARGQRFELDLEADNWKFDVPEDEYSSTPLNVVKEIQERNSDTVPTAPTLKSSKTGFPEHRNRRPQSAFKQQSQAEKPSNLQSVPRGPSDRAILHHAAKKQGVDLASTSHQSDIDKENQQRLNDMSLEEIKEAREELMAQFKPDKLQAFLRRANIDDDQQKQQQEWDNHEAGRPRDPEKKSVTFTELPQDTQDRSATVEEFDSEEDDHDNGMIPPPAPSSTSASTTHFPAPPRNKSDYKPLDPSSDTFLTDLREHYFPDLPHRPSTLSWLQDPTDTENAASSYNPERTGFAPSALRFGFNGLLITPTQSLEIPTTKGLHHHGDAPSSAGYTVPELALLARSTLANQRSVAYQITGRILFRLGRGDLGPRGSELCDGLWTCIERERIVEVMMAEANRDSGHMTARTYATEALWLWRRGGGGDRGVLREGERRAT